MAAVALLLLALPNARGAHTPDLEPAASALVYPQCTMPVQQGADGGQTWAIPDGGGVTQPVPGQANVAACSLQVVPSWWGSGNLRYVQWDPETLAPDPTTVALRTRGFLMSALGYWPAPLVQFVPPLVMRRIPGLAETPGSLAALDLQTWTGYYPGLAQPRYAAAGDPGLPVAFAYGPDSVRSVLPGPHPVLAHTICGGDAMLQDLYVVQSVMTCSAVMNGTFDVVQRFRVPLECQLRWFEVASGPGFGPYGWPGGRMGILDAAGDAGPPSSLGAPLVSAGFAPAGVAVWTSHFDFDHIITLEPGHDYWLWVRANSGLGLNVKTHTGSEPPAFTGNVGPFYVRYDSTSAFTHMPDRVLDFRLIGVPLGMVGVTPALPPLAPLRLRVEPNPARGLALVRWSGASGALRFEVLDVRGRRVGEGAADALAEGRWLWNATRAEGGPLPNGVYFVRATDATGRSATERVVIVR